MAGSVSWRRTAARSASGSEAKGVSRYAYTAGGPNSCVLGADGVLYACQNGGTTGPWRAEEMVTPSIQRIAREGGPAEIIATELDGKRFNGPNDLVFGPDGRLYFTDPGTYRPDDPEPSYLFVLERRRQRPPARRAGRRRPSPTASPSRPMAAWSGPSPTPAWCVGCDPAAAPSRTSPGCPATSRSLMAWPWAPTACST